MPYIISNIFDYPIPVEIEKETDCYYWVKSNSGFFGTRVHKSDVYQNFETARIEIIKRLSKKLSDSEKYELELKKRIKSVENLKGE